MTPYKFKCSRHKDKEKYDKWTNKLTKSTNNCKNVSRFMFTRGLQAIPKPHAEKAVVDDIAALVLIDELTF